YWPPGASTSRRALRASRSAAAVGGRAVAAAAEHERTRRAARVLVARTAARPAGRQRRRGVQERTADPALRGRLLREPHGRQRARLDRGPRAAAGAPPVVRQATA